MIASGMRASDLTQRAQRKTTEDTEKEADLKDQRYIEELREVRSRDIRISSE
jgi:hypothetical protein